MWTWTEFFGGKTCCPLDIEGSYFAFEIAQDGFLQKCSRKLELNAIYFEPFQKNFIHKISTENQEMV